MVPHCCPIGRKNVTEIFSTNDATIVSILLKTFNVVFLDFPVRPSADSGQGTTETGGLETLLKCEKAIFLVAVVAT